MGLVGSFKLDFSSCLSSTSWCWQLTDQPQDETDDGSHMQTHPDPLVIHTKHIHSFSCIPGRLMSMLCNTRAYIVWLYEIKFIPAAASQIIIEM